MPDDAVTIRRLTTPELTGAEIAELRRLLVEAFGSDPDEQFGDDDWDHATGGIHVLAEDLSGIVAHAAVVERPIEVDGRRLRTGYVEAVATRRDRQGRGHGRRVMEEVGAIVRDGYELGMLGTGVGPFYERLGWRVWRGPSAIRTPDGVQPTPDDDGYLMVLETPATPRLDPTALITCDWRPGDSW
jgi:aminoglycoside 2'-N-acetyltransferase I